MEERIAEFKLVRDCALPADSSKFAVPLTPPSVDRSPPASDTGSQRIREAAEWRLPPENSPGWKRMLGVMDALDLFSPDDPPLIDDPKLVPSIDAEARTTTIGLLTLSQTLSDAKDLVASDAIARIIGPQNVQDGGGGGGLVAKVKAITPAITGVIVRMVSPGAVPDGRTVSSGAMPDGRRQLTEATRLAAVAALVLDVLDQKLALSREQVRSALGRTAFLPSHVMDGALQSAGVKLIRAAAVSDLYVVRSEWRGYAKGEIAALKNVMAGEIFKQASKDTREIERIEVIETQQTVQQEVSEETRTTSELSREVSSLLTASLQANASGEVTGAFPGGTYRVGASAQGNIGLAVAERLASRTAQEAVKRAVSRIDSSMRTQRSTRSLVKLEDQVQYELTNTTSANRRGVYRWLDRVERFMVFKVPDQLQLEFQLPNPAEFYKYRQQHPANGASTGAPPDWMVTLAQPAPGGADGIVTQADVDALAAKYRASDLPPEPKQALSLTETVLLEAKNLPADDQGPKVVSPVAAGTADIVIPDGYEATEVLFFMSGSPSRAKWVREKGNDDGSKPGWDQTDPHVFHSIVLESFVGGASEYKNDWLDENQGLEQLFTTQGSGPFRSPNFGNAYARSTGVRSVKFVDMAAQPPYDRPVRVKLKLGFKAVGAAHMQIGVQVICRRTAERYASWRQQVFDTLFAAWSRWDREFRSAQNTAAVFGTSPTAEQSPARNRVIIHEELKRQVISWLLEEIPFDGRPAMKPAKPSDTVPWREFDLSKTVADAPTIQFFEQALDWPSMSWIFYPYYWAARDEWVALATEQGMDPDYERFMRAGSSRVLVPVRRSFEQAMLYWLAYRRPYLGRGLPLPNEPMFVSLASEIRWLTEGVVDGEPVERAWDSRTSTPYLWLEDRTDVPRNEKVMLGLTRETEPVSPIELV